MGRAHSNYYMYQWDLEPNDGGILRKCSLSKSAAGDRYKRSTPGPSYAIACYALGERFRVWSFLGNVRRYFEDIDRCRVNTTAWTLSRHNELHTAPCYTLLNEQLTIEKETYQKMSWALGVLLRSLRWHIFVSLLVRINSFRKCNKLQTRRLRTIEVR